MHLHAPAQNENTAERIDGTHRKKILIVDDHSVVRRGLATLINEHPSMQVCGDADNESDALGLFRKMKPDLLLADWSLKQSDSSGMIAKVLREAPDLPVLVLSIHDEMTHAPAAIEAGARGYIMKREAAEKIIEGIESVLAGEFYLGQRALTEIANTPTSRLLDGKRLMNGQRLPDLVQPKIRSEPFLEWAVSIVVPVYNSEPTIEKLCEQLFSELREVARLEIVLVDDGSTDDSALACNRMGEKFPSVVRPLRLTRNFGEHNAVLAGLAHATGDYCVIMDDDLQNPPSEVKTLLREISRGYDVVYSRYPQRRHPLYRRIGSVLQNWTAERILGKPPGLYLSSFKVFTAEIAKAVCQYDGPKPYLDALILRSTNKIGTAECQHRPRARGESSYTWAKLVGLWCRLSFGFSVWPLRALAALGLMVCLFGLFAATSESEPTPTLPWASWIFGGVLLLQLAAVGEYIGWLLTLSRKPPQYLLKEKPERGRSAAPDRATGRYPSP
jgi:DNA-binding NarL/FixJ family response regulator